MKKVTDINWHFEAPLPDVDDCKNDSVCSDDCKMISFNYNGHHIEAEVSFTLFLETEKKQGGSDQYMNFEELTEVMVNDVRLELIRMYHNDGEEFNTSVPSEFFKIQNYLENDLKTQY